LEWGFIVPPFSLFWGEITPFLQTTIQSIQINITNINTNVYKPIALKKDEFQKIKEKRKKRGQGKKGVRLDLWVFSGFSEID
jgi:hypothetical protein